MATLTNKFNADESIVAAVANDSYRGAGDISITGLNRPPQMRVLEKRHGDKIVEDVSDRLASLRGQVAHGIAERSGAKNEWSEKRISAEINGWTLTGQPDKFEALQLTSGILKDHKFPTLSSFLFGFQRDKGLKPEYVAQGNGYAWLLHKNGINVVRIVFMATLLEWSKRHAKMRQDYPDRPFFNFEIPLWDLGVTEAYLTERVKVHQRAETLPDDKLPECTKEERWMQDGVWKVYGANKNKSLKNFTGATAEDEARAFAVEKKAEVKYIAGEAVRCNDYCRVKAFCHQVKREMPEGVDMTMAGSV